MTLGQKFHGEASGLSAFIEICDLAAWMNEHDEKLQVVLGRSEEKCRQAVVLSQVSQAEP